MTNSLQNSQVQVAIEMWRYNPRKLSKRNVVDELSLALALRGDADERVEEAVAAFLFPGSIHRQACGGTGWQAVSKKL